MGGSTSQRGLSRADETALIAADVGGTHARVARLERGFAGHDFAIVEYRKYFCADYPGLAEIIDAFRGEAGGRDVDRIALAVAGHVIDDAVVNVNLPWSEGRISACEQVRDAKGRRVLKAAANPRGMQGYAVGR